MAILAGTLAAIALAVVWTRRHPRAFPAAFSFLLDIPLRDVILPRGELAQRVALEPRMRVLEIGPGTGFYTEALVDGGATVVCLDLQPAMLLTLRQRLGARAPQVVCGSASALPFRDRSFDRVLLMSVLGEVPDRAGALRESARLLTDDGTVFVAEALPDPDFIPASRLAREAAGAGLRPLERTGAWPAYTQRLARSTAAH